MSHVGLPSPPLPSVSTHRLGLVGFNAIHQLQPLQLGVFEASSWEGRQEKGTDQFPGEGNGASSLGTPSALTEEGVHAQLGHIQVLGPLDGLWRGAGPGAQVLLVGIVGDAAEAAQLQRALLVRQQQAFLIIHQALRDTAQDPASICSPGHTVSPPSTHPGCLRAELTAPGGSALFNQHPPHTGSIAAPNTPFSQSV